MSSIPIPMQSKRAHTIGRHSQWVCFLLGPFTGCNACVAGKNSREITPCRATARFKEMSAIMKPLANAASSSPAAYGIVRKHILQAIEAAHTDLAQLAATAAGKGKWMEVLVLRKGSGGLAMRLRVSNWEIIVRKFELFVWEWTSEVQFDFKLSDIVPTGLQDPVKLLSGHSVRKRIRSAVEVAGAKKRRTGLPQSQPTAPPRTGTGMQDPRPEDIRQKGRPRGKAGKCSKCGEEGHNVQRCPQRTLEESQRKHKDSPQENKENRDPNKGM